MRREHRYNAKADVLRVDVIVDTAKGEKIPAELVNLSGQGACVRIESPVDTLAPVRFVMSDDEQSFEFAHDATVQWSRTGLSQWCLGMRFTTPAASEMIDTLARSGYLERRQDDRTEIVPATEPLSAQARLELSPSSTNVLIVSAAKSGLRLLSTEPFSSGLRIALEVQCPSGKSCVVLARFCWQQETRAGYVVGCEYALRDSYAQLKAAIDHRVQHVARTGFSLGSLLPRIFARSH